MNFLHQSSVWWSLLLILLIASWAFHLSEFNSTFFALAGLSFLCELVDSSLGMGYGTMLTSALILVGYAPKEIIPTLLLCQLFSGFACAYFHNQIKNVDLSFNGIQIRRALLLGVASVVGLSVGVNVAEHLSTPVMITLIGCIVTISGLLVILLANVTIVYRNWKMVCVAIIAAFNKSISGGGYGPLVTSGQILSGIKGKSAVGITAFAEGFTCLLTVLLFSFKGEGVHRDLFIPLFLGALASVPLSAFLVSRFREKNFKVLVGIITMILGSLLILKGFN